MYLDKLASVYQEVAGPPGIPWDGLVAKGHEITENGYDPAYMDFMLQESFRFFGVIGGMSEEFRTKYASIRNSEARKAVTQLMALVDQTGADVWYAMRSGDFTAAVNFPRSVAVDVLATLAASAANGAYLHFDGVIESAMRSGKLSPEEVMAHAQSVVRIFQTFVDLDKNGNLDDFKPGVAVSGVGLAPLAVAALAALGVMVIVGMCYTLYLWKIAAPIQNKVFEWCDKLASKPDASEDDLRACVAAAQSMAERGNASLGDFLGGALKPIAVVLGVGVAIYVASIFAPLMMRRRATS